MSPLEDSLLPGVPTDHVRGCLDRAGGKEIESGKFASPESSAALAVNCFGWFVERPEMLPPFVGLEELDWPAKAVDVEYQARFPWSGGRHPWLDAMVLTNGHLIGVESKRFEPFRDKKSASLSEAYDRLVWGERMQRFEQMRDDLRSGERKFDFLDAAQLVKHAFGLVTDAARLSRRPVLVYVFAEPGERAGKAIPPEKITAHREEIEIFARAIAGDAVGFAAFSYRDWLSTWSETGTAEHGQRVLNAFSP